MNPSPELIQELRAARPTAPTALRIRIREVAAAEPPRSSVTRLPMPSRRALLVALPAAAVLALASAGVIGLARSGSSQEASRVPTVGEKAASAPSAGTTASGAATADSAAQGSATQPAPGRAQRVTATLTVEVRSSNAVSRAAQDALDLTRSLGGYVVSSSVATGDEASASITVRVPVGKVQDAVVGLSGLGRIVSQQVTIQDLQEPLDAMQKRETTVSGQIARIRARLATESLDPETQAVLRTRLQALLTELRDLRTQIAATSAEARMSTIQLGIVTPGAYGAVAPRSRLGRTIEEALNVLAWEGIVLLGLLVVLAPLVLAAVAVWLGQRFHRRREEERLLAAP